MFLLSPGNTSKYAHMYYAAYSMIKRKNVDSAYDPTYFEIIRKKCGPQFAKQEMKCWAQASYI